MKTVLFTLSTLILLASSANGNELEIREERNLIGNVETLILKDQKHGCEYIIVTSGSAARVPSITPRLGSCPEASATAATK